MDTTVRSAALNLAAKAVSGLGGSDRSSLALQSDAMKLAVKAAKESTDPSAALIRVAAAELLRSDIFLSPVPRLAIRLFICRVTDAESFPGFGQHLHNGLSLLMQQVCKTTS